MMKTKTLKTGLSLVVLIMASACTSAISVTEVENEALTQASPLLSALPSEWVTDGSSYVTACQEHFNAMATAFDLLTDQSLTGESVESTLLTASAGAGSVSCEDQLIELSDGMSDLVATMTMKKMLKNFSNLLIKPTYAGGKGIGGIGGESIGGEGIGGDGIGGELLDGGGGSIAIIGDEEVVVYEPTSADIQKLLKISYMLHFSKQGYSLRALKNGIQKSDTVILSVSNLME